MIARASPASELAIYNYFKKYSLYIHTNHQQFVYLVKNIQSVDWLVVRDEVEAILTESNLIKEHRPKYNILLKDDKSFPYIQITKEPYPQVILVRLKKLPKN